MLRKMLVMMMAMAGPATAVVGDLNLDGAVDLRDFFIFSDHFGQMGPPDTLRVEVIDTLRVEITVFDTVEVMDTLRVVVEEQITVFDTLAVFDTLRVEITVFDTVEVMDTLRVVVEEQVTVFDTTCGSKPPGENLTVRLVDGQVLTIGNY